MDSISDSLFNSLFSASQKVCVEFVYRLRLSTVAAFAREAPLSSLSRSYVSNSTFALFQNVLSFAYMFYDSTFQPSAFFASIIEYLIRSFHPLCHAIAYGSRVTLMLFLSFDILILTFLRTYPVASCNI